jgi:hypothetical protein
MFLVDMIILISLGTNGNDVDNETGTGLRATGTY